MFKNLLFSFHGRTINKTVNMVELDRISSAGKKRAEIMHKGHINNNLNFLIPKFCIG